MTNRLSRRRFAAGVAALPMVNITSARGETPEFEYKLANNNPMTHPNTVRQAEAIARINAESKGRLKISHFPNNQLGGDTDMLSQLRSGAIDFFTLSGLILSTFIPVTSIYGIGYSLPTYKEVWAAMDGDLGGLIRHAVDKAGLHAFDKTWDNGFRQITSSTRPIRNPDDLKGFKIRVPVSPLWTSMFEAFAASPVSINFSEVYSALQTKIVEGQENPLVNIDTAKLYEVQKYCSMTRHMWDGFLMLGNGRAWRALPADLQAIVARNFDASAIDQRADYVKANDALRAGLEAKGMVFNEPEPEAFRQALIKAGFYTKWKEKYGSEAWAVLEQYAGKVG